MQILESVHKANLWPLSIEDFSSDLLIGNRTLRELQLELAPESACLYENAWVDPADWQLLCEGDGMGKLLSDSGDVLAFIEGRGDGEMKASSLSRLILHVWDLIAVNDQVLGSLTESKVNGEVSPAAHIEGVIEVGEGSRILPGVVIEGHVIIGKNCKVGPNCYIRGNTSIGNDCYIGHAVEVKNSLIGHGTSIGHLSYVGDSVIGNHVNFGAGTITANFRHDGGNHRSTSAGTRVDTGRRKLGALVGDGVKTGIHTSIYPGRALGPGVTTRPGDIVHHDL